MIFISFIQVLQLHRIARKLNEKRVLNGALRLDQPKLKFSLDDETKMPNGVSVYEVFSLSYTLLSC